LTTKKLHIPYKIEQIAVQMQTILKK